MSFAFDCLLASYLLLSSLTIWCAQSTVTVLTVEAKSLPAGGRPGPAAGAAYAALRVVEPALASLPHALGSLGCLVAALALFAGTPFDIRYAAICAFAVALYLVLINLSHLIEDWRAGVPMQQMVCVRSTLPALLAAPMIIAGFRLL